MRCVFRNQPNDPEKYLPRLSPPRLSHLLVRSLAGAHGNIGLGDGAGLAHLPPDELALLFWIEGFTWAFRGYLFPLGGAIADRADRKVLFVITQSLLLLMELFLGVMDPRVMRGARGKFKLFLDEQRSGMPGLDGVIIFQITKV